MGLREKFTANAEQFDALMVEMLGENDRLEAENAELKRQLAEREGWIDCNERLPEVGIEVVVFYKAAWGSHYCIETLADEPQDGLYWAETGSSPSGDLVTHWMPLPAAPKQGD